MNLSPKGHSAEYIKRQAKKIKKEAGVPHHEALDKASQKAGFSNWKHFVSTSGSVESVAVSARNIPYPSTVSYGRIFSSTPDYRPNARMPIPAHQEIGKLLKEVCAASDFVRKSVFKPVDSVRCELDDWVQCEYKSHEELPNDVFFDIYYHGPDASTARDLSAERKDELAGKLYRVKEILTHHYHNCKPVRSMHKRLDRALKALDRWLSAPPAPPKKRISRSSPIPEGTYVRFKPFKGEGIVMPNPHGGLSVSCFTHNGPCLLARYEVSVCRDQTPAERFKPMRLYMPYGKWTCADGTEVLFNRDYCPMWARMPDGTVIPLDPDTWVSFVDQDWYFGDGTAPWDKKESFEKCMAVLEEWGVANKKTRLLGMLPTVIKTGKTDLLKEKNYNKKFPHKEAA